MEPKLFTNPLLWLSIGAILLVVELFGFTGFVIGVAIAGFVVALLTWLGLITEPISAAVTFGLLSIVFTFVYWRFFRSFNLETDAPNLHNRALTQVGKVFTLSSEVGSNVESQFVGDTRWRIRTAGEVIPDATEVKVTAVEKGVLIVEAV